MTDLHHVLGVNDDAGEAEIKKAFRRIALECHPDRHSSSSEESKAKAAGRFKAASEAYEALMKAKRLGLSNASKWRQQQTYQQYYSRHSQQQNPYGYSRAQTRYRARSQTGSLHNFLMALSRNMSRTDAMFHVGLASLLTFGIILAGPSGDYLWSKWNQGQLYKDLQDRLAEQEQKRAVRNSSPVSSTASGKATSGQTAANMAAAAGLREGHPVSERPQGRLKGLKLGSREAAQMDDFASEQHSREQHSAAKPSASEADCLQARQTSQRQQLGSERQPLQVDTEGVGKCPQAQEKPDVLLKGSIDSRSGPQEGPSDQDTSQSSQVEPSAEHHIQPDLRQEQSNEHFRRGNADERRE